jgi:nucleoside phosphorylase
MKPCAIIFTALNVEYTAARSHLTDIKEEEILLGNVYERGVFSADSSDWEIGLVQTGKGNVKAGFQTERAIAHFRPDVIIFLGVAGGMKDVRLGDVVAAEKVYEYESFKDGSSLQPRPEMGISAFRLVERAQAEARKRDWTKRIGGETASTPHVFYRPNCVR